MSRFILPANEASWLDGPWSRFSTAQLSAPFDENALSATLELAPPPIIAQFSRGLSDNLAALALSSNVLSVSEDASAHLAHGDSAMLIPSFTSLGNPQDSVGITGLNSSAITSQGATPAQLQQALGESDLIVNGSGIKVGVLSDSFNDLGGAAADEADGALPAASNINVIKDLTSGGTDEGRAMMQIIHDIAPGASLAFYTAFNSEQDFANGILALAAAGCKVIVDDVIYFDEPFFQNGVVAQAIQKVEAEGVTYVTAAGNNGSDGYQATWTPISGTFGTTALKDAESFGGSLVQAITIDTKGTGHAVPLLLEWNQPYGLATSDLELLVFNSFGQLIGTATNASAGEPTNPWIGIGFNQSGTYYIAIENLSGPDPGVIKEITAGNGLPATISGANVGTVFGHAMTPGTITAGAVSVADTPAFGLSPPTSESFSSSGLGTELLISNSNTELASPDVLSPVALSGVDGIETTLSGGLGDFFGTSAAAASLAGVAALVLAANPTLSPAAVEQIMEATALPMANPAVSGAGLAQVDTAVGDALAQATATSAQINDLYQAVLQRAPTHTEISGWLAETPPAIGAAVISSLVQSAEAQNNVNPVIQIIDLATDTMPTFGQLAGWVPFVESGGLLHGQSQTNSLLNEMATAFVSSTTFANTYNNGLIVDPDSTITAVIVQGIIANALGEPAASAQINAWTATGLTVDQVFVDFALGDQYTAAQQAPIQKYLTTGAEIALATHPIGVSLEASHSWTVL